MKPLNPEGAIAATEPCATCGGSGWLYFGSEGDTARDFCPDCQTDPRPRWSEESGCPACGEDWSCCCCPETDPFDGEEEWIEPTLSAEERNR